MAHLSDEDREDLVAFLDGELDEDKARQLEGRLNLDPQVRAEAEAFQQTWGLLDYLPRPEPSESFTHRTLERLAVQTSTLRRGPAVRWLAGLAWAAGVVLAAGAGLWAAGLLWPKSAAADQALVRHLRVIDNLPRYEQIDDLDFLKALDAPDLFGEDPGS